MIQPAKEWKCENCGESHIQTGPHAASLLPLPPVGWAMIDVTRTLEPHSIQLPEGKVKMGWSRSVVRRTICPKCVDKEIKI